MKRQQKEQVGRLFTSLVRGDFDEFLSGCATDLIITSRSTSPVPATLIASDVPDWFGSLRALTATSLRSTVEVTQVAESTATVILRHAFSRNGVDYRLETVNLVAFRDGLLAQWSSYPLDLPEYARAWQTKEISLLQPV